MASHPCEFLAILKNLAPAFVSLFSLFHHYFLIFCCNLLSQWTCRYFLVSIESNFEEGLIFVAIFVSFSNDLIMPCLCQCIQIFLFNCL